MYKLAGTAVNPTSSKMFFASKSITRALESSQITMTRDMVQSPLIARTGKVRPGRREVRLKRVTSPWVLIPKNRARVSSKLTCLRGVVISRGVEVPSEEEYKSA